MHARSRIIERNAERFQEHEKLLVIGPPVSDDIAYLNPARVITFDYRVFCSLKNSLGCKIQFSLDTSELNGCDSVLIFIPKAKAELDLVLAFVAPVLAKGASIYLVGEKKAGIASAARKLQDYSVDSSKLDSAKHCQLWHATLNTDAEPFLINDWISSYEITVNDISLRIASIPGVFSFCELDEGTELLLEHMFTRLSGRVLDFGCGSGVLGCYTKRLNPSVKLEMVDISLLALKCAEETARINQIDAEVYPSDGWSDVKGRVNALVTNPPFHQGVDTEYSTTEGFIKQAKDKLAKHAPFLLVANSFLKYSALIEGAFGRVDTLAETNKFRIYKAFR